MPNKKTLCKTCVNRTFDAGDKVWFCGLSGKEIKEEATEAFEDEKAYCINHAVRATP